MQRLRAPDKANMKRIARLTTDLFWSYRSTITNHRSTISTGWRWFKHSGCLNNLTSDALVQERDSNLHGVTEAWSNSLFWCRWCHLDLHRWRRSWLLGGNWRKEVDELTTRLWNQGALRDCTVLELVVYYKQNCLDFYEERDNDCWGMEDGACDEEKGRGRRVGKSKKKALKARAMTSVRAIRQESILTVLLTCCRYRQYQIHECLDHDH